MGATTSTTKQKELVKYYLEYLEKEITFTGIITTFTVASLLFIVDKQFSTDSKLRLIETTPGLFILAMLFLSIAALLLLIHRQKLSFHYGMICLEIYSTGRTNKRIDEWLDDIDSWIFWRNHLAAIGFMLSAYGLLATLFLISLYPHTVWATWIVNHQIIFAICYTSISIVVRIWTYRMLVNDYPESPRE
ncbi:hypothetical protein [Mucilaginibacter sp. AK015]|uniref:hypothetical protein n=1 Tax=Mucilaginibacter sp. AK015 TaxID=2723072 RepID=UPI00160E261A|nr:hypothetical protein [Mucilaginibacter sp. AK015]MBB5397184.1 hypothetical protein [Mucilaginibacter sp. AK015]